MLKSFFHYKKLVQWKGSSMLKVLHETIDAKKEPLLLRVYIYFVLFGNPTCFSQNKNKTSLVPSKATSNCCL